MIESEKTTKAIQKIDEFQPLEKSKPIIQIDTQALITHAIEKESSIEVMERLLAMRRELKEEAARDAYFQAMANFQRDCPVIEKKVPVYDKSGKLRYRYAPLDDIIQQVKPYFVEHGFSYTIKTKHTDNSITAHCNISHRAGHKEIDEEGVTIPIDEKAYMNVAQKVASALTYAKRYAFCDAFGIITGDEDDDSNFTGEPGQEKNYEEDKKMIKNCKTSHELYTVFKGLWEKYVNDPKGQGIITREKDKKKREFQSENS